MASSRWWRGHLSLLMTRSACTGYHMLRMVELQAVRCAHHTHSALTCRGSALQKLRWFIEKGRADAKAWAEATGVLALVGPENQRKQEGVQRGNMENAAEQAAAPAA
jgi:hypothetical protein